MTEPPSPPPEGKYLGWLNAVKGLTFTNLLVIAGLAVVAVPTFVIYQAVTGNEELMDRLLSTYQELPSPAPGCILRHVKERGGPDLWAVSTGFAFRGSDRWNVSVILNHNPGDETVSYCEAVKLIADKLVTGNGQ